MASGDRIITPVIVASAAFSSTTGASGSASVALGSATAPDAWFIKRINWSCSGDPTGGTLTIADGTITIVDYLTSKGPGFTDFGTGIMLTAGKNPTITLDDGSANASVSFTPVAFKAPSNGS